MISAVELVRLARIPSAPGIAQAAIDALGTATEGFPGLYGEASEARHATPTPYSATQPRCR